MSENPVAVTQVDRDAAAAYLKGNEPYWIDRVSAIHSGSDDALVQAFARHRLAGLEREADGAPGGGMGALPAGMKPWQGGDSAPEDWDEDSPLALGNGWRGVISRDIAVWQRGFSKGARCEIVAYTPKPTPPASVSGEVVVPRAWAEFVYGIRPWEGDDSVWFGDAHPTMRGKFWWRKQLGEALSAAPEAATHIAEHLTVANATPAVGGAEAKGDTVAFVQKWMMSGDHEPDQWHRDFAAAIDDRVSGDGALHLIRGMLTSYAGQPNLYGDLFKIADAAPAAAPDTPSAVGGVDRMREAVARLLCEQHGGDPEAVATEEHDSWEGPLWTVFGKDADAIIALATGETSPERGRGE